MKVKTYPIQIWFLDIDLEKSAEYLNNKLLNKTINGCYQALVSAYMYAYGIRNKKFHKYYFDKTRKFETMDSKFPCWPLKLAPTFNSYGTKVSKWTRKCKEHFEYVKKYMEILCNEYEFRTGKQHGLSKFISWIEYDAPKIKIPTGNIKKITVEWKILNPKWRRKDIIEGYRLQYKALLHNDGINANDFTKRDIPEWLLVKQNSWLD